MSRNEPMSIDLRELVCSLACCLLLNLLQAKQYRRDGPVLYLGDGNKIPHNILNCQDWRRERGNKEQHYKGGGWDQEI